MLHFNIVPLFGIPSPPRTLKFKSKFHLESESESEVESPPEQLTNVQLCELRCHKSMIPYMDSEDMEKLAQGVELTKEQIKNWHVHQEQQVVIQKTLENLINTICFQEFLRFPSEDVVTSSESAPEASEDDDDDVEIESLTNVQICELRRYYSMIPYMDSEDLEQLAGNMEITAEQIKKWHKNSEQQAQNQPSRKRKLAEPEAATMPTSISFKEPNLKISKISNSPESTEFDEEILNQNQLTIPTSPPSMSFSSDDFQSKLEALEARNQELEAKLEDSNTRIFLFEKILETQEAQRTKSTASKSTMTSSEDDASSVLIADLVQEVERLQNRVKHLEQEILEQTEECQSLEIDNREMYHRLKKRESEAPKALKNRLDELQFKLKKESVKTEKILEENRRLQKELDDSEEDKCKVLKLQDRCEHLEQKLREMEHILSSKTSSESIQEIYSNLREKIEAQESEIADYDETMKKMNIWRFEDRQKIQKLTVENQGFRSTTTLLNSRIEKFQADHRKMMGEKERLIEELDARIERLQ